MLQTVVPPPASPLSGKGDARWISNVGDFGGVVVVLFPIEQLECLLGTDIDSMIKLFCCSCLFLYGFIEIHILRLRCKIPRTNHDFLFVIR